MQTMLEALIYSGVDVILLNYFLYIILGIALFTIVFLALRRAKRGDGMRHEAQEADKLLSQGGRLVLVNDGWMMTNTTDDDRWEESPISSYRLKKWGGLLTEGLAGNRRILYGNGLVMAHYSALRAGLLHPQPGSDRRLFILPIGMDDETPPSRYTFPGQIRRQLKAMCDDGWQVFVLAREDDPIVALVQDLPVTLAVSVLEEDWTDWVQQRMQTAFHTEDRRGTSNILDGLIAAGTPLLASAPRLAPVVNTLYSIVGRSNEVESFYQLLKVAEYIIHYRALLCLAETPGLTVSQDPSFGAWNTAQMHYSKWEDAELDNTLRLLGTAAGGRFQERNRYDRACSIMVCLYNHYVGHGTMVYRVTPEITAALAQVTDRLIREFYSEKRSLSPQSSLTVKDREGREIKAAAMVEKEDEPLLFSSLVWFADGPSFEYISYSDGTYCYVGEERHILVLNAKGGTGR